MLFDKLFSWLSNHQRKDQRTSEIAATRDATPPAVASQSASLPQVPTFAEVVTERSAAVSTIAVVTKPAITNCVEFIYGVMNELYRELGNEYGANTDEEVKEAIREYGNLYDNLNSGIPISYDTRLRQFAYLYRYATIRACVLSTALSRFSCAYDIFDRSDLRVCCIGGGPGTDLIGITKYLGSIRRYPNISALICDRNENWSAIWEAIRHQLPDVPRVETQYMKQDFVDVDSWQETIAGTKADLYTISYCFAEFRTRHPEATPYFRQIFQQAPSGSYLLFTDIWGHGEDKWFDRLSQMNGFQPIADASRKNGHGELDWLTQEEVRSCQRGYNGKRWNKPLPEPHVAYRLCRKV